MNMELEFNQIISSHNGILFKVARSYTSDQADFEDLYQEILIQVWKSLSKFKQQAKVSTWLYKVALNTALTFVKKEKKNKLKYDNDLLKKHAVTNISEYNNSSKEKIELLYKCINELKKGDRAIILLYLEQCSYDDIAEIVGISVSNVGVKINRIKAKLFELLKANNYE